MTHPIDHYQQTLAGLFAEIAGQKDIFRRCGEICAKAIAEDRLIHVIGPGGHSNMALEEVLWRAGSIAAFNPILDPGTNVAHGAQRSNIVERTPGYARAVFDSYRIGGEGEVLIIVNAYGINAMTIDSAELAKERGMTTIGVTSTGFAKQVPQGHPSRHPSGKNLFELVDVFVDNKLPFGDAVVEIGGIAQKLGPTSTFANCFCMNCIQFETAAQLVAMGVEPPVWTSANLPGGDEANRKHMERYAPRVKHLR